MPFGATVQGEKGASFALWAPAARQVRLRHADAPAGGWHETPAGQQPSDGWWHCHVPSARAGTRYQWLVDGTAVPDPASRSNPDGPHGASEVVDPLAHDWRHVQHGRPWNEVVLYELHLGTFTPQGTLTAAIERLPYLRELGFTAIELMPVATFSGAWGWGYDGVLPFAPHPAYGTPEDFKRLIDAAHGLGLMVVLDVVYNHFGPDGNYLGLYAPQFLSTTHHSPWGQAINFDDAQARPVREFFIHNALYWIEEYRLDGLRLDAVHTIIDDSKVHVPQELSQRVRAAAGPRHVHLVLENEHKQGERLTATPLPGRFDGQWNDDFHHALRVLLTGEATSYYHDYRDQPLAYLARSLSHGYVFAHVDRKDPPSMARTESEAQPLGAMVNFIGNHDQVGNRAFGERLGQLIGPQALETALLLSLLTPAIPLVFMGDEFAASTPFLYFANWQGELAEAVRTGRQRDFNHAAQEGAAHGWSAPPDPCDVCSMHSSRLDWAQAESPSGHARRALVRSALAARARWIAPRHAQLLPRGHVAQLVGDAGMLARWLYRDGQELVLRANLGEAALVAAPEALAGVDDAHAAVVFSHGWPPAPGRSASIPPSSPGAAWPAWSGLWSLQERRA